jgi:hypothetical protein
MTAALNLKQFAREKASLPDEEFLRQHTVPFLLLDPRKGKVSPRGEFKPHLPLVLLAGVEEPPEGVGEDEIGLNLVLEVKKTRDRRFPELITVGRGPENDVVIDNPSISKLHAFFRGNPGDRSFTVVDSRSTNGTLLDGATVPFIRPVELESGGVLIFGGAFRGIFNYPEDLYDYMKMMIKAGRL